MSSRRKLAEGFLQLLKELKESQCECKETEDSALDLNDVDKIDRVSRISDHESSYAYCEFSQTEECMNGTINCIENIGTKLIDLGFRKDFMNRPQRQGK